MKKGVKRIINKKRDNKKIILWAVLIIIIAVLSYFALKNITGYSVYSSESVCNDSDGGLDYYKYGEVTYVKSNSHTSKYNDKCSWGYLIEGYCKKSGDNSYLSIVYYKCKKGCKDGTCISENTCTPKTCLELGKKCGKFDNKCGKTIDCGSCSSRKKCVEGKCESDSITPSNLENATSSETDNQPSNPSIENNTGKLVAYYRFEDNMNDESGNKNHGTNSYYATFREGKSGQGLAFSGDNGAYATVGDSNSLDLSSEFTISTWVYYLADNVAIQPIIVKTDENDNDYWLQLNYGKVNIGIKKNDGTSASLTGKAKIPLNTWVYITGEKTTSDFKIYINGKLDNSGVSDGKIGNARISNRILEMGRYAFKTGSTGYNFIKYYGILDEVKIWDYSLSEEEVLSDYTKASCISKWVCSIWSSCVNNQTTRTCNDKNNCSTEQKKPKTLKSCSTENTNQTNITTSGTGTSCRIGDTIGLYDQKTGIFYLKNSNTPGQADITFKLGPGVSATFKGGGEYAKWDYAYSWNWKIPEGFRYPIAGDFDGDGIDTVGLYDPKTATFSLKNSNTPGPAEITFKFGPVLVEPTTPYYSQLGPVPIVFDWNNDGKDEVGVIENNPPDNKKAYLRFYLKNNNDPNDNSVKKIDINTYGGYGTGADFALEEKFPNKIKGVLYSSSGMGSGIRIDAGFPIDDSNDNYRLSANRNYENYNQYFHIKGDWNNDGINTDGYYNSESSTFNFYENMGYDWTNNENNYIRSFVFGKTFDWNNLYFWDGSFPIVGKWDKICDTKCVPDCNGKECGDDNCGVKCYSEAYKASVSSDGKTSYPNVGKPCINYKYTFPNKCIKDIDCGYPYCGDSNGYIKPDEEKTLSTPKCINNKCIIKSQECSYSCNREDDDKFAYCYENNDAMCSLYWYGGNFCSAYGNVYHIKNYIKCYYDRSLRENMQVVTDTAELVKTCSNGCYKGDCVSDWNKV